MEKREEALREALARNADETVRWENYKKENTTAIENLETFSRHLTVDVMVPVGQKAFMPGQLIHTNEVLVGHFQGYFSKCSAHKAKEICEHRLHMAEEHLKKLRTEEELWQNKLEKPYVEGVLPNAEECEIIEDYDEEKEKRWREQHKLHLRKAKLLEKQAKINETEHGDDSKDLNDEQIFKMLEEAELLEELEQELESLQVDEVNDETIRKLMSGEMKLPAQKKRTANESKPIVATQKQCIVKKTELKSEVDKIPATNNNNRPNQELIMKLIDDEVDSAEELDSELPKEVQIVKEQAKFLPTIDQIGFYEYQIQIIQQKLQTLSLKTQQQIEEKIHLLSVLDNLEELLELAEETVGAEELAVQEAQDAEIANASVEKEDEGVVDKLAKPMKRRISFALEDQTLEFRRNETVSQMLPKTQRDIISLDEPMLKENKNITIATVEDKREKIAEKVEKSLSFVAENQSKHDFDLVNKILDYAEGKANTLHISFKHSDAQSADSTIASKDNNTEQNTVPGSPADFYKIYKSLQLQNVKEDSQTIFIDGYEGEDQVKSPILREANRQAAYEDPRLEFLKNIAPQKEVLPEIVTDIQAKSILRNKSAVDKEQHLPTTKNVKPKKSKTKTAAPPDEAGYMSVYNKVMNEVIEKPITEPESLPTGKFIDAHAPKKRVSRFKQQRTGIKQT